jgi:hypothetical protein
MAEDLQHSLTHGKNGESIQNAARRGREQLGDAVSRASERIDTASTSVGRGVEKAGDLIDTTAGAAANSVREMGRYMQRSDPATMREDFVQLLSRHPGTMFCVGIGAGVLLAQMFRRG